LGVPFQHSHTKSSHLLFLYLKLLLIWGTPEGGIYDILKSEHRQVKASLMKVFFLPGEESFLTFQLANGSGWLTSHRLVEHTPDKLKEGN
jgi:hypothetical protein